MHSRVSGRGPIGRNTNLYHAKGEIHVLLKLQRQHTCEQIDNYVKWVLLSIGTGILQVDQQPTSSMMMAKLHLGLSIGTGILQVDQ